MPNLMDVGDRRLRMQTILMRLSSVIGIAILLLVSGRLVVDYLPSFGRSPCETNNWFFHPLRGLEAILILGSIWWLVRLHRSPSWGRAIAATLFPLATLLIQDFANDHETQREKQCQARSLNEAMIACHANPAHYRRGKDAYGYDVLTVVAPGTTDSAWRCLSYWAPHKDVSLKVDKSVYAPRLVAPR